MAGKTYRIGEAADLLQLKSYVLRFWETEFTQLAPLRTDKGQRLYTEEHLELLRRIRHLLHEQGMTIDGARRVLIAEQRLGAQTGKGRPVSPEGIEPFVPHSDAAPKAQATAQNATGTVVQNAGADVQNTRPAVSVEAVPSAGADALRVVRDELLELRNLLLSQ